MPCEHFAMNQPRARHHPTNQFSKSQREGMLGRDDHGETTDINFGRKEVGLIGR